MPSLDFQGKGKPLSSDGLAAVAEQLDVQEPEIWAVLAVETSGCGYLPDRRPQILFERHIFHRLTNGRFDSQSDISAPTGGGYVGGAGEYDRLAKAMSADRTSALKSASWGLGQIMGENHKLAGFSTVEDMVAAVSDSEDKQLEAMQSFLEGTRLAAALKAHDWTSFARGYNGPNFAENKYDIRLNAEFQKYSAGVLPDLSVRAAQLNLTYLGFNPGRVDGIAGRRTLAALADFQLQRGLENKAEFDGETLAQLDKALNSSGNEIVAA